ncbi:hypothetical protein KW798_02690 [Candidatus Parcubacteria bacterium]|nr:hypothetical protein [Candidatus Parcubacteria bacterium]
MLPLWQIANICIEAGISCEISEDGELCVEAKSSLYADVEFPFVVTVGTGNKFNASMFFPPTDAQIKHLEELCEILSCGVGFEAEVRFNKKNSQFSISKEGISVMKGREQLEDFVTACDIVAPILTAVCDKGEWDDNLLILGLEGHKPRPH